MMTWWEGLAIRERRIVLLAALALFLAGSFVLVIEPGLERRNLLNSQLQNLVDELAWLEARAPAVRARMLASGTTPAVRSGGSPLGVVDVSARAAGLGSALRRVRPLESAVEAELQGASYAALMGWLGTLEDRHGLQVVNLSIDRGDEPGRVNAQLRIEPAGGRS